VKVINAIRAALAWSGKYDKPGETLTVSGVDAYGRPMTETIPALDGERLEADAERISQQMLNESPPRQS
jgi:hypothetical protein